MFFGVKNVWTFWVKSSRTRRDPNYRTEKNTSLFLNGKISDHLAFKREPHITVFDFSLIEFDCFTRRLSMNYRRDEQNFISLQEILDDYVNNCSEKETFPLQVKKLGMILKEAFPQASRVHRRVNDGRVWQYPLSKTSRLEEDCVKWEDLQAFTKEFDKLLSSSSDDFFEWIKVQSQDLCEGNRVLTEVKIIKDWTFVVHVNSRKVAKETVAVFELGAPKKAVVSLPCLKQVSIVQRILGSRKTHSQRRKRQHC